MARVARLVKPSIVIFDQALTSLGVAINQIELVMSADDLFDPVLMLDECARMRSAKQKIEALDKLITPLVKEAMPKSNRLEGIVYEANLVLSQKRVLDTDKVKVHLGQMLEVFQVIQHVESLTYKPKV